MVDQDENESGNPGHTHPGASALLWGGVFIDRELIVRRARSTRVLESSIQELRNDAQVDPGRVPEPVRAPAVVSGANVYSDVNGPFWDEPNELEVLITKKASSETACLK
ncbi:hypothetical protein Patl1_33800 [Pistacia atlantica]|uniref:Uncharacterized protein n=1 Tax=Pistacia atlantica TaxID=434234 RepID=A0ACC0ZQW0_9ROSI|nr:hypothetical protein Patl1_33800 [Pistacia atlantica]